MKGFSNSQSAYGSQKFEEESQTIPTFVRSSF